MIPDTKFKIRGPVKCSSGLTLSVQASKDHYCTPQNDEGPFSHVEISSFDTLVPGWPDPICKYNELTGRPINATYYYVSAMALMSLIFEHGGVASGELPKLLL